MCGGGRWQQWGWGGVYKRGRGASRVVAADASYAQVSQSLTFTDCYITFIIFKLI